jgi:hypothetical protein
MITILYHNTYNIIILYNNIISTAAFIRRLPHCELMVKYSGKGTLLSEINGKGALENIDMNSYC